MKRFILLLLPLILGVQITFGQNIKRPDSYNYNRGVEAIQNNNTEEALEYLNKELDENPNNGYALAWIATVRNYQEEYGRALTAADLAIKHIPKKDKQYRAFAYIVRAEVYVGLGEAEKGLADLTSAVNETPDDPDVYERRANLYYYMDKYDLADKDYQKIISLNPGSVMGYMGIGRNANAEKRYNDAIEQFDYVTRLASNYSSGYSFRAESYIGINQFNKAIDDIIRALNIDGNDKAFNLMFQVADSSMVELVTKLKVQSIKSPNNDYWPYCLGVVHEHSGAYSKAIDYYISSMEKDRSPITANRISNCYSEIGNFTLALEYIDEAIVMDSTNYDFLMAKADLLYESGDVEKAIKELDIYVNHYPEFYGGYYRRGWYKDNKKDVDGAIEDYTMSIVLDPNYAYAYLGRGDMYVLKNDIESAKADFNKVIELDTIPNNSSCAQYAYWGLGEKEEAINFMNKVIANDPDNAGNYYDAACLHSRMGELEKAIGFMETAFEKGYRRFAHMELDNDLDAIRELPNFKELVKLYKNKFASEVEENIAEDETYENRIAEIPFTKENGVCKVKCSINDLPLYFVFDTGASDVSISSVEATFMMKNGYLKSTDVIGKQNYMMANGEISAGTILNIRNVNFGGLDLDNIRASVVHNQTAPLLLGQSVLNRLGNIEIDNSRGVIKITYKKKIEKTNEKRNQ
jgi:clan AA aspartic protease (TIGR02281 family)